MDTFPPLMEYIEMHCAVLVVLFSSMCRIALSQARPVELFIFRYVNCTNLLEFVLLFKLTKEFAHLFGGLKASVLLRHCFDRL